MIEKVAGHEVKKFSIFIQRVGYLEEAVEKGYQTLKLAPKMKGNGYRFQLTN